MYGVFGLSPFARDCGKGSCELPLCAKSRKWIFFVRTCLVSGRAMAFPSMRSEAPCSYLGEGSPPEGEVTHHPHTPILQLQICGNTGRCQSFDFDCVELAGARWVDVNPGGGAAFVTRHGRFFNPGGGQAEGREDLMSVVVTGVP
jgi:hypothetical protein